MSEPLWTAQDLRAATGGTTASDFAVTGISIDSRTLQAGDLFIAITGESHDGHDHAVSALANGAAGLLLSRRPAGLAADAPVLAVADTFAALEQLASAARARATGTLVAITGSVGKTTTKEMVQHIAKAQGSAHATQGNLNNHIGLPLTLARLPKDTRWGVFELGMNHANEIAPLSRRLRPHHALITAIGTAHIENFADGQRGIAKAKAEIFAGLEPGGSAIIAQAAPYSEILRNAAAHARILTFGTETGSDAQLTALTLQPEHSDIRMVLAGTPHTYTLPLAGEHMAMNSVAALLLAHAAGLDVAQGAQALANFSPLKGRGLRKNFGGVNVIDECYNASPLSMIAAIKVLGQSTPTGRRIAVLGDMLELGSSAPAAHAELAPVLEAAKVDLVFCCGPLMQNLWQVLPASMKGAHAPTAAALAPLVAAAAKSGDSVLVKGSRGQQVNINGVMSPSMAVIIAALQNKPEFAHAL